MKKNEKYCATNDPLSQRETDLFERIEKAVKEKDVIQFEDRVSDIFKSPKQKIISISRIAAMFFALLSISAIIYYYSKPFNIRLYNAYYKEYRLEQSPNYREANSTQGNAFQSYNSKKYKKTADELSEILLTDPSNYQAHLLLAISLIELKKFDEAETQLLKITEASLNFYTDDALWYFSLLQIRNNNLYMAKNTLASIDKSSEYFIKAQKLIQKIDDKN